VGGRKLSRLLQDTFRQQGIACGRDKLFTVLRLNSLLIKPRKRYIQTTMSRHWMRKYPNLLKQQKPSAPEQAWVSDITYVKTAEGYCYLSLITDAYSCKIVGYNVSDSLEAIHARRALTMAVQSRSTHTPLIHHSDRGFQYCSSEYVSFATQHNIRMSMTEHSDPYENALAERMNRTLKEEFGLGVELPSKQFAALAVKQAVELYNTYRPRLVLNGLTPQLVHKNPQ
jgi:putative transposase